MSIFTLLLLMLFSGITMAGDPYKEANPDAPVIDNSQKAQDWMAVVQARKSGNEQQYQNLLEQYTQSYPENFYSDNSSFNKPYDSTPEKVSAPFNPDWMNGDNVVSYGGTPNPGIFERNLLLRIDSLGTQYTAYITANRDTIVVWRSTNNGQNWERWRSINPGGTTKWHSFDMYITDTTGGHTLGFAGVRTPDASSFAGQLYWFGWDSDGDFRSAVQVAPTLGGRGLIEPSIISDGRDWSAGLTYWYIAYRNVDASSGVGDSASVSFSGNWGNSWSTPHRVRGFDDYDLDIDYNFRADTIYVALTNTITPPNGNLRLMKIALGSLGTGSSWTQVNITSSATNEHSPDLAVNRNNNNMGIVYNFAGTPTQIYRDAWDGGAGSYWGLDAPIFVQTDNQDSPSLDCNIGQYAFRCVYRVDGSSDTIIYTSTTNIITGFTGHTRVSHNTPTGTVFPDIAGYTNPANGGAVVYAGFGASPIFYDNSFLVTGLDPVGNQVPERFSLSQNYPNPFNPTTNIKFEIPTTGFVKLVIYDMLGKEVTTLVNDIKQAGSYSIDFNASSLTSGVYFYKISSGEFSDIKKMMLVK
ncbi:MAG TPA: T9SS type A sorting domain-containing protein [Ignavibacteria bacterium]|nr:T9SS type A sorting domain-containing protein [Ignavibacteria bacterium]